MCTVRRVKKKDESTTTGGTGPRSGVSTRGREARCGCIHCPSSLFDSESRQRITMDAEERAAKFAIHAACREGQSKRTCQGKGGLVVF